MLDLWLIAIFAAIIAVMAGFLYHLTQVQGRASRQAERVYLDERATREGVKWDSLNYPTKGGTANHSLGVSSCKFAKSPTAQTFDLNGRYASFTTAVVLTGGSKSTQPMHYSVKLDGNEIHKGEISAAPNSFTLHVTHAEKLTLLVFFEVSQNGCRGTAPALFFYVRFDHGLLDAVDGEGVGAVV
jgi:hypothetical protein